MFPYVHWRIIYNSQDMEANLSDQNMVYVCVHIYNGILLSHKKEWNNAICSNMNGPRDYHIKCSKSDIERQISLICGIKKNDTNELIYKTEIDSHT